jgi:hypothetical protein
MSQQNPETNHTPNAGQARSYIEAMLVELADLAASRGERRLATTLRMVALEAARAPEQA